MRNQPPAVGIILGGGGIAGYSFHAAMLAALQRHTGFDPRTADIIVGTSAGAITGAVLRGGVRAEVLSKRLYDSEDNPRELANLRLLAGRTPGAIPRFWTGPGSPQLALRQLRRGTKLRAAKLAGGLLPRGRLSLAPITEPIDALHGWSWPDDDLWIPATDLETGWRLVFGRDHHPLVSQAVHASAALPGFFAPANIDGRTYVDGGLTSAINADLLVDYITGRPIRGRRPTGTPVDGPPLAARPLDLVIVSAPLSMDELSGRLPMSSAIRAVPRRQLQSEVLQIEALGAKTMVLQPSRGVTRAMGLNPMDHNRIRSILEASDELTHRRLAAASQPVLDILENAGRVLTAPPDVPYPELHDHDDGETE